MSTLAVQGLLRRFTVRRSLPTCSLLRQALGGQRPLSSGLPEHSVVAMPALSPTMATGTIGKWLVNVGDKVGPGDAMAEIETDKASMAFEAQDEFYVAKLIIDVGKEVPVGSPIMITCEEKASVASFESYDTTALLANVGGDAESSPSLSTPTQEPMSSASDDTHRLPLIKFLGKRSLIKNDVAPASTTASNVPKSAAPSMASVAAPGFVPEPPFVHGDPINQNYTDIPNSNMRKVIAKRLAESKATVPHYYVTTECVMDELLKARTFMKNSMDMNVSVNDIVIKAAALALRDVPAANAKWDPSQGTAVETPDVDISVAVATPNGLITPIVTKADDRALMDINSTVRDLATRARDNKLKPEEFQGGSFTISNLGMFGVSEFTAVINPPQACILAVGGSIPRVFPPTKANGKPITKTTMSVSLSADRRVVDEEVASQFLLAFKERIGKPTSALLA